MKRIFSSTTPQIALLATATLFSGGMARADNHVLPLSDLHTAISQAGIDRNADRSAIDRFLSEPRVRETLKNAGMDADKVQQQASLLTDQEQAQLAARARAADRQISAGELKDAQVTLIIMAVAAFAFLSVLVLAFK